MHTVAGGQASGADRPAFVAIPGYSTGSSFLFKLFDGLSAAMRLYAIDLLGTGLSGGGCCCSCRALAVVCRFCPEHAPKGHPAAKHALSLACRPCIPAPLLQAARLSVCAAVRRQSNSS